MFIFSFVEETELSWKLWETILIILSSSWWSSQPTQTTFYSTISFKQTSKMSAGENVVLCNAYSVNVFRKRSVMLKWWRSQVFKHFFILRLISSLARKHFFFCEMSTTPSVAWTNFYLWESMLVNTIAFLVCFPIYSHFL